MGVVYSILCISLSFDYYDDVIVYYVMMTSQLVQYHDIPFIVTLAFSLGLITGGVVCGTLLLALMKNR